MGGTTEGTGVEASSGAEPAENAGLARDGSDAKDGMGAAGPGEANELIKWKNRLSDEVKSLDLGAQDLKKLEEFLLEEFRKTPKDPGKEERDDVKPKEALLRTPPTARSLGTATSNSPLGLVDAKSTEKRDEVARGVDDGVVKDGGAEILGRARNGDTAESKGGEPTGEDGLRTENVQTVESKCAAPVSVAPVKQLELLGGTLFLVLVATLHQSQPRWGKIVQSILMVICYAVAANNVLKHVIPVLVYGVRYQRVKTVNVLQYAMQASLFGTFGAGDRICGSGKKKPGLLKTRSDWPE